MHKPDEIPALGLFIFQGRETNNDLTSISGGQTSDIISSVEEKKAEKGVRDHRVWGRITF